jgi:hypothetical protein
MKTARIERMLRELQAEPAEQFGEDFFALVAQFFRKPLQQPLPVVAPELRAN